MTLSKRIFPILMLAAAMSTQDLGRGRALLADVPDVAPIRPLVPQSPPPTTAPTTAPAASQTRAIVESATAQVLAILRDSKLPLDQKSRSASEVVENNIDFPTFARLAVGPSWNQMTPPQRDEFLAEFHKLVRGIFIEGIDQYAGQDAVVADEKQDRADRIVRMRIIDTREGKRRDAIGVDFRLRQFDGTWKAIDLSIANISIAVACRAQFVAVLRDGGIPRVIQVLKQKNADREKQENHGQ